MATSPGDDRVGRVPPGACGDPGGVARRAAVVYVVAFAMSLAGVFFNPAASSVLPALVPKPALVAANTGIWTAAVLS